MRTIAALLIAFAACTDASPYTAPAELIGSYDVDWHCASLDDGSACFPAGLPGFTNGATIDDGAGIHWFDSTDDQGVPDGACLNVDTARDNTRSGYAVCAIDATKASVRDLVYVMPRGAGCLCNATLTKW